MSVIIMAEYYGIRTLRGICGILGMRRAQAACTEGIYSMMRRFDKRFR